jgi:hypothetical protein
MQAIHGSNEEQVLAMSPYDNQRRWQHCTCEAQALQPDMKRKFISQPA